MSELDKYFMYICIVSKMYKRKYNHVFIEYEGKTWKCMSSNNPIKIKDIKCGLYAVNQLIKLI